MKKQYNSPKAEVFILPQLASVLAHFSADADITDIGEMNPEDINSDPALNAW